MQEDKLNMIGISVIIPIYGVERFIERCSVSLMEQTIKDGVEFIFVDDASKDKSRSILEEVVARYPARKNQVKILTHSINKGLPAARNTGLKEAKGEYIYHFDGDDFADKEMLESMLKTALKSNADYVWSDWYLTYEKKDRYMAQPDAENVEGALKLMLDGKLKYNVWNKLVKRSLYNDNDIYFPEGYSMGEDMTMIRVLTKAKSVAKSPGAWYHYVKTNSNAMTVSLSPKHMDEMIYNVELTSKFLKEENIIDGEKWVSKFKLSTKYPFLYSYHLCDYHKWDSLWPESNRYISREDGFRPWLIQICGKYRLYFILYLHYWVYDFLYNKIYK